MNIKELLKKVTEIETAIRSAERIASGRSSPGWIPDRGKKQATAAETIEIPESAKPLIKELKKAFPENAGDIDLIITHIMEEISHKPHEIPANIDLTWIDEASNASDDQKEGIRQAYIALLPYARLVYVTEKNGMPEEHAKKLATMLGGKKEVITYLDRYLKLSTNVLTMHDACLFGIPEGEYTLDTWQALSRNNLQDKEFRNLLAQASDIERLAKGMAGQRPDQKKLKEHTDEYSKGWKEYKSIRNERVEKQDPDYKKERFEALKTEMAALRIKIADAYAGAGLTNKMEMLILLSLREKLLQTTDLRFKYFLANGLTRQDYDKFIGLDRAHAGEEIPDITIDGRDMGYPGYYLKKIPVVTDADFAAKAAVLGKLTGCCQSLSGEAGEPCAIYGLTSPHSGFYMICKGDVDHPKQEDELLAQTWVWRSQTGAIVFDSVERSSEVKRNEEELKKVREMINYLAFKLAQEDSIPKVIVGRGSGISTSFGEASYAGQERFIDYTSYSDARDQAVVVGKENQFLLLGKVGNKDEEVAEAFRKWLGNELANKDIPLEKNQNILNMINLLINHPNERVKQIIDTVISGTEHKEKYEGTQKLVREYLSLLELLNNNEISAADFLSKVPSMEPAVIGLKTKDGYTVAQSAARLGYGELLKLVIEKNPEVILEKDNSGQTLAHWAAETWGDVDVLKLVIEKQPEVILEKDNSGSTPVHWAIENGNIDALELMIEKQPEVISVKDNDGNTVLSSRMDHIFKGSEEDIACARMLIENGADFSSLEEKARLTGKSLPPEILDAIEEKRVANEA